MRLWKSEKLQSKSRSAGTRTFFDKNTEPVRGPDCDIAECVRCCDVKESRRDIFRAEVQANLTGTLMATQSDCSTSVSEHVCTNLAHSSLSCSFGTVCVMELTAGHHFFPNTASLWFPVTPFFFFSMVFSLSPWRFKAACVCYEMLQNVKWCHFCHHMNAQKILYI